VNKFRFADYHVLQSLDAPFATAKRYHRKDQRVDLMRSGRMRGTGAESRPEM
jgi:hypothetical protein